MELTAVEPCVLHSVWWEPLLSMAPTDLSTKRIVCHMSGEPFRYLSVCLVTAMWSAPWIAGLRRQDRRPGSVRRSVSHIPISLTPRMSNRFTGFLSQMRIQALRREWKIPDRRH